MKLEINQQLKKKLAREILIFTGIAGLMPFVILTIWIYSLSIKSSIRQNAEEINNIWNEAAKLASPYQVKLESMERFISSCKFSNGLYGVSQYYTLSNRFSQKELEEIALHKNRRALKIDNSRMPAEHEYLQFKECFRGIDNYKRGFSADYETISAWQCLIEMKDHLFDWMPIGILKNYKFDSRTDLISFIHDNTINNADRDNKFKSEDLLLKINVLKKEGGVLHSKIATYRLERIFKSVLLFILVLVYPLRLVVFIFIWALRNYR
jgi:hypothetical protein